MRKLRLKLDELAVETFDTADEEAARGGTVRANESDSIDSACTRDQSCYWEVCQGQETADPRQRLCYTPYYECDTRGWTCLRC